VAVVLVVSGFVVVVLTGASKIANGSLLSSRIMIPFPKGFPLRG